MWPQPHFRTTMEAHSETLSAQIQTHHHEIETHEAQIRNLHTEIKNHETKIKTLNAQVKVHEVQSASHKAQALQLDVERCQVNAQQQKAFLQGAQMSVTAADDDVTIALENQRKFAVAQLPPKLPAEALSPLKPLQGRVGRASEGGPLPGTGTGHGGIPKNSYNFSDMNPVPRSGDSRSSTGFSTSCGGGDSSAYEASSSMPASCSNGSFRVARASSNSPSVKFSSVPHELPQLCDNNGHKRGESCNNLKDLGLYSPCPPEKERTHRDSQPMRRSTPNRTPSLLTASISTHNVSSNSSLKDLSSGGEDFAESSSSSGREVKQPNISNASAKRSDSPSPLSKGPSSDPGAVSASVGERVISRCLSYKMALSTAPTPAIILPNMDPITSSVSSRSVSGSSVSGPATPAAVGVRASNRAVFGRTPSGRSAVSMSYEPPNIKSMVNTSPLTTSKGSSNPVERTKATK